MSNKVLQASSPASEAKAPVREARLFYIGLGMAMSLVCVALMAVAFITGRASTGMLASESSWNGIPMNRVHPELLSATATQGGLNMAVCTAPVDDNAEGFFALDYKTGELNGWVYYPRMGGFGGRFNTNVAGVLGGIQKNPEYLLVSGAAASAPTGTNVRAAGSLLYVVDTKSGQFAAFTIPWNKSMESSGGVQINSFVLVGQDQIRNPDFGGGNRPKPPAGNPNPNLKPNNNANNNNANNNGLNGADPNDPDMQGNPNNLNPNNPKNNGKNNPNNKKPGNN